LKKGTFSSAAQLKDAIDTWTGNWNEDPQPFIWKKPADEIITKVKGGRTKLALAWIHRAGEAVDEFEAETSDSVVAF
jgi:hypothetical protein